MAAMRGGGLYFQWEWPAGLEFGIKSLDLDLRILNDPTTTDVLFFSTQLGCGTPDLFHVFYFGVQSNVQGKGKGLVFSRFGTLDLANAKTAGTPDSWSVSSSTEGGFVGVRRLYAWTSHAYDLRLSATNDDSVGRWFGFWVIDRDTGLQTYVGALRFPKDSKEQYPGVMTQGFGSFIEHANSVRSAADVPFWDLAVGRPNANGSSFATRAHWWYAPPADAWQNSDIWAADEIIRARMGAGTQRAHAAGQLIYHTATRDATPSGTVKTCSSSLRIRRRACCRETPLQASRQRLSAPRGTR
jgi:hypothetical protein